MFLCLLFRNNPWPRRPRRACLSCCGAAGRFSPSWAWPMRHPLPSCYRFAIALAGRWCLVPIPSSVAATGKPRGIRVHGTGLLGAIDFLSAAPGLKFTPRDGDHNGFQPILTVRLMGASSSRRCSPGVGPGGPDMVGTMASGLPHVPGRHLFGLLRWRSDPVLGHHEAHHRNPLGTLPVQYLALFVVRIVSAVPPLLSSITRLYLPVLWMGCGVCVGDAAAVAACCTVTW